MIFSDKKINPKEYSPLPVAYVGDSVYDLFIRTKIAEKGNRRVTDMHKIAVGFVKANSQAASLRYIEDKLTEEEKRIVKWGKNAKSTPPKNADATDYSNATGFETLVGYLYLEGNTDRLKEVLNMAYDALCNKE